MAGGQPHQLLKRFRNSHLHLALAAALLTASLIAFAIPITRSSARDQQTPGPDLAANTGDALVAALRSQAETVTQVLASPGVQSSYVESLQGGGVKLVPSPLMAAAARVAARGILTTSEVQASLALDRQNPIRFTLHQNGFTSTQSSAEVTIGRALADMGIHVSPSDAITPNPDTALTAGVHVYLQYANSVRLVIGGKGQTVRTRADSVGGLLTEQNVSMAPTDQLTPGRNAPIRDGMIVNLMTIRDIVETVEKPIEFTTVYQYDAELPRGQSELIQPGVNGALRRQYRAHQINGQDITRDLISETVVVPTDQVILLGTFVPDATPAPTPVPAPPVPFGPDGSLNCVRTLNVHATYYTPTSAGGTTTATGTGVYRGIIAVDPRVIPLGTQMYVPGYGYGVAADTGGGVIGNFIDLGFADDEIHDWYTHRVDICIL